LRKLWVMLYGSWDSWLVPHCIKRVVPLQTFDLWRNCSKDEFPYMS
jgi:hypothetical protein